MTFAIDKITISRRHALAALAGGSLAATWTAWADDTTAPVKIGQSVDLTGPLADLGPLPRGRVPRSAQAGVADEPRHAVAVETVLAARAARRVDVDRYVGISLRFLRIKDYRYRLTPTAWLRDAVFATLSARSLISSVSGFLHRKYRFLRRQ